MLCCAIPNRAVAFEIMTKSHRIAKGFWAVLLCFTGPELPPACKMCLNNNNDDDHHHNQSGGKLRPFEKTVGAENVVGALRLPAEGPFLQSSQGQMSVATCPVSSPSEQRNGLWEWHLLSSGVPSQGSLAQPGSVAPKRFAPCLLCSPATEPCS